MSGYPYAGVGGFVVPPVVSGLNDNYVPSRDGFGRYDDIVCPGVLGHPGGSGPEFTHVPRTHGWTGLDGFSDTSDNEDVDGWGPVPEWFKGFPAVWAGTRRGIIMQQEGQVLGASHLSTHRSSHWSSHLSSAPSTRHGSSHRSGAPSTRHGTSHRSGLGGSHHGSGNAFQSNIESHRPSERGSVPGSRYGLGSSHHGSRHDSNFGGHSSHHGHHSSHGHSHHGSHHGGADSPHGTRYGLASSHHGHHSNHHGGASSRHGTSRSSALRTELSW